MTKPFYFNTVFYVFSSINDHYCADWDVLLTLCSTNDDPSNQDFGDIAWRTSNIDENFVVTDYRQFEVPKNLATKFYFF